MERLDKSAAIACSLSDSEFRERRALARTTLLQHIERTQRISNGLRLEFANSDQLHKDIEKFVSLERQCCGFLTFTIERNVDPTVKPIVLTIEGPSDAVATIETISQFIEEHS